MTTWGPVLQPEESRAWTIDGWRAASPYPVCAHRGAPNGHTRGEFTWQSYANAIAQGFVALEASCHRSSDGVWVLNHNATTGEQYTTDVAINATPWSTLAGLTRRYGDPEPMVRLDEFLATYADRYVLLIENKTYANFAEFELLTAAADPEHVRIVAKYSGDATSTFAYFHSRGYTTWGYFFGTAGAATLPTEWDANMDWVGLSAGPGNQATAQEWWDWCATRAIPVIGHIVYAQADWDAMKAQGAAMAMVNNDTLVPLS